MQVHLIYWCTFIMTWCIFKEIHLVLTAQDSNICQTFNIHCTAVYWVFMTLYSSLLLVHLKKFCVSLRNEKKISFYFVLCLLKLIPVSHLISRNWNIRLHSVYNSIILIIFINFKMLQIRFFLISIFMLHHFFNHTSWQICLIHFRWKSISLHVG